jgi:hypothetical protein
MVRKLIVGAAAVALLVLAPAGIASASHGADDPIGHNVGDDRGGHGGGHGADDPAGHH